MTTPTDLEALAQFLTPDNAATLRQAAALLRQQEQVKAEKYQIEQNALQALFYAIGQHPDGQAVADWSSYRVSFGRGVARGYGDTALKQVISAVCQLAKKRDPYAPAGDEQEVEE